MSEQETDETGGPGGGTGQWVFDCRHGICDASSSWDTEVEALDAAGTHTDNTGHFDFEIVSPEGMVAYP